LIVSVEDDLADTLKPRLMAEGDLARCFFVQGTKTPDGLRAIDLSRDMKGIEKAIEDCGGVKLIVLDPVVSAVAGDSHKNTDVRRGLQPIVDLAMRSKAAILGITHFSKVTGALDPASRVIGSIGFVAVARNVFIAQKVKHPNGLERGIFAKAKTNTSSSSGGFEYVVSQVEITEKINASQIVWGEQLEGDATEFFAEAADGMRRSEKDYLDEILKQALRAGPVMTEQILEDLGAAGYTEGKIKRAASRLGVLKRKSGMRGPWTWSLPVEPEIDA
jgi:putative DNA primase/helicase